MSTLLKTIPRKVWTREETHQLTDSGLPGLSKLELVNGELIDRRMGKNPPHVFWHTLVRQWLEAVFGGDYVRSEAPIDVAPEDNPTSEPEPDLVVTKRSIRESAENPKPGDIVLLVEIADKTLWYDSNFKAQLYARAGIEEYWIVNVPGKKLVAHRGPVNGEYTRIETYASDEEVRFKFDSGPTDKPIEVRFCLDSL